MKKIITIFAIVLALGLVSSTVGVAADIYGLFGARNAVKVKEWPDAAELVMSWDCEGSYDPTGDCYGGIAEFVQQRGNRAIRLWNGSGEPINIEYQFGNHYPISADHVNYGEYNGQWNFRYFKSSVFYVSVDVMLDSGNSSFASCFVFENLDDDTPNLVWEIDEDGRVLTRDGEARTGLLSGANEVCRILSEGNEDSDMQILSAS